MTIKEAIERKILSPLKMISVTNPSEETWVERTFTRDNTFVDYSEELIARWH